MQRRVMRLQAGSSIARNLPLADPTRTLPEVDAPNEGEEASAPDVTDQEETP